MFIKNLNIFNNKINLFKTNLCYCKHLNNLDLAKLPNRNNK